MDFRAGREENLRRWFCAFGRKQENKHWLWAGIVTSMTDIMTLPLMLVLCLQQCVSLGYHLTKVVATESFWSKGTQGLTQFFLLRVKRMLNSDLLFCPVRSAKNPRAEIHGWKNGCDWMTPRAEGRCPALAMTGRASGHSPGGLSRSLEIPFPMAQ